MFSSWRSRLLVRLAILAIVSVGLVGGVWYAVSGNVEADPQRGRQQQAASSSTRAAWRSVSTGLAWRSAHSW